MPIYVTEAGFGLLRERLARLEQELLALRKEKAVAYTESGDTWHDNPGFNALEQAEARKALDISDLRQKLGEAVVCAVEPRGLDQVRIGSIVRCRRTIEEDETTTESTWEVVGFGESNPKEKKVGYDTPVGGGLMGLRAGGSRSVEEPRGPVTYEALRLFPTWTAALRKSPHMKAFFLCGGHCAGKTSLLQTMEDQELIHRRGSELGKDLFYERKLDTASQGPEFEAELTEKELARDSEIAAAREQVAGVETWHPGNIAYAMVRNPDSVPALVERARTSPLLGHVRGVWLRVTPDLIRRRSTTFKGNVEWAVDFYGRVDAAIGKALELLDLRDVTIEVDASGTKDETLCTVRRSLDL